MVDKSNSKILNLLKRMRVAEFRVIAVDHRSGGWEELGYDVSNPHELLITFVSLPGPKGVAANPRHRYTAKEYLSDSRERRKDISIRIKGPQCLLIGVVVKPNVVEGCYAKEVFVNDEPIFSLRYGFYWVDSRRTICNIVTRLLRVKHHRGYPR